MSEEREQYRCIKCKTPTWLSKPLDFCVCGGKLYATDPSKFEDFLGDMFGGAFRKGKKK